MQERDLILRIYLELEELRTYHLSMTTSQKDSCWAQYLRASLSWHCQSRLIKRTESYLRQLLTAHIYFKMNEENQTVRADKNPVCCLRPCAIVVFRHSLTLSEDAA